MTLIARISLEEYELAVMEERGIEPNKWQIIAENLAVALREVQAELEVLVLGVLELEQYLVNIEEIYYIFLYILL